MTILQKLALAAFVTGVATVFLVGGAWLYKPTTLYMTLAGLTSFAVGYLSFEFSAVVKAFPGACKKAWAKTSSEIHEIVDGVVMFAEEDHPYIRTVPLLATVLLILLAYFGHMVAKPNSPIGRLDIDAPLIGIIFIFWLLFLLLCGVTIAQLVRKGAWIDKKYYDKHYLDFKTRRILEAGLKIPMQFEPLTNASFNHWLWLGTKHVCYWVFWRFWIEVLKLLVKTFYELGKTVHSNYRLMVAVDGPLGGLVALVGAWVGVNYLGFGPMDGIDYAGVALCGGLTSSALIAANYRWVTRFFGITPQTA